MEHINQVTLRGSLQNIPEFSHENHGRKFYRFYLEVPRLSGTVDILPVVAHENLLKQMDLSGGYSLRVSGQIRSHNCRTEGTRRLLIFVFAEDIICEDGEPINQVELMGNLCKMPNYRRTPLGREICDVMLAVSRGYHRADYLPCILWGRTASEVSGMNVSDCLMISGRLQSRNYIKQTESGPVEKVAYEISALTGQQYTE
jgi:single-stranded DNA-binding protein